MSKLFGGWGKFDILGKLAAVDIREWNGKKYKTITVVVTRTWQGNDGSEQKKDSRIKVELTGPKSYAMFDTTDIGQTVSCSGNIETRTYTVKATGEVKEITELKAFGGEGGVLNERALTPEQSGGFDHDDIPI